MGKHGQQFVVQATCSCHEELILQKIFWVGSSVVLYGIEIIGNLREDEFRSEHINGSFRKLVGLINNAEVARNNAIPGRVRFSHLLCSKEEIMVGDLKVVKVGTGCIFQKICVFAFAGSGAVITGAFHTDPGFDMGWHRNGVQIQSNIQKIQGFQGGNCFAVDERVKHQ